MSGPTRQGPSGRKNIFTFQVTNDPGTVNPNTTQTISSPVVLLSSDIVLRVTRAGGWNISQGGLIVTGAVDPSFSPPKLVLDYVAPGGQAPGSTTYDVVILRRN